MPTVSRFRTVAAFAATLCLASTASAQDSSRLTARVEQHAVRVGFALDDALSQQLDDLLVHQNGVDVTWTVELHQSVKGWRNHLTRRSTVTLVARRVGLSDQFTFERHVDGQIDASSSAAPLADVQRLASSFDLGLFDAGTLLVGTQYEVSIWGISNHRGAKPIGRPSRLAPTLARTTLTP